MAIDDFKNSLYLQKQLITYLGNKRKLLPLIYKALEACQLDYTKAQFIDFFAGSGVVSRLAKMLNFSSIICNDWEFYSYCSNKAFLEINEADLPNLFKDKGGLEKVLQRLNSLSLDPKDSLKKGYISRYYAPVDTKDSSSLKERLFYTAENALKIDAIRNQIEEWYPEGKNLSQREEQEKYLLLGLLLYKTSTNTNTSGVFKAYYRQFGGYGQHALGRILATIELPFPCLQTSSAFIEVCQEDALELAQTLNYDKKNSVAYLDPPYNGHQYGSNYHLLNSIARWDKIPVSSDIKENGSLKHKAGIRKDWVETKSSFCYKKKAVEAFTDLLNKIQSHYILISYSTEGVIPFDEMSKIASQKGKISLVTNPYIKYRGGHKSATRLNRNIEFVLMIDTLKKSTQKDHQKIQNLLHKRNQILLFDHVYHQEKMKEFFDQDIKKEVWRLKGSSLEIPSQYFYKLILPADDFFESEAKLLSELERILKKCCCSSKIEELEELEKYLKKMKVGNSKQIIFFLKEFLKCLKHLAYSKTKKEFVIWSNKALLYQKKFPNEFLKIEKPFMKLKSMFEMRIKKKR